VAADHLNPEILRRLSPERDGEQKFSVLEVRDSQLEGIHYEKIEEFKELKACLRLRYEVYRYVNFIGENKDHLDIDPYDFYSTFLGAYDVTEGRKHLIGAMRVISGDKISETAPFIEELIRKAADPNIRSINRRPQFFPIMESFQLPAPYLSCFQKSSSGDNSIHPYEISRLAIRPDYWLHSIDIGLHYLLIMDSWLHKPSREHFIIAVHPRAQKRYEKLGLKVIPGTGQVIYKRFNQLAVAMITDMEKLLNNPRRYGKNCESLFGNFKKNKFFTLKVLKRPSFNHINNSKD
jgi:hypothetical protein